MDDARGAYASDQVYSDIDIAVIEALPPTAIHRPVDLAVVAADVAGYACTHIIMPSVIYGVATGPLFDTGIANSQTIIFPLYVRAAVINGHVAVLNEGVTLWADVHITDSKCTFLPLAVHRPLANDDTTCPKVTDMYIRMFDALLSTPENVSHGRDGYFIGENGEFVARENLQTIADALFAAGRISSPKLVQYSDANIGEYYGKAMPVTIAEYGGQVRFPLPAN